MFDLKKAILDLLGLIGFVRGSAKRKVVNGMEVKKDNDATSSKWEGKTIYTFGDSITWYDGNNYFEIHKEYGKKAIGYQAHMRNELRAKVKNYGKSGATTVDISRIIKSHSFKKVDAVTITGGVNDWNKYVPIGEIQPNGSNFDTNTSYGAIQSAIEYIAVNNPYTKIYLMTPIPAKIKEKSDSILKGQEFPISYRDMFIEIGKLYNIPVLDWYKLTGFNKDYDKWYKDKEDMDLGDRYFHVGDEGYKVMAEYLIPFLNSN